MFYTSLAQVHRKGTKINTTFHTQRQHHAPHLFARALKRCCRPAYGGCEAVFAAKFGDDIIRDGFPNQKQVVDCSLYYHSTKSLEA
jgi:hypothetical protein